METINGIVVRYLKGNKRLVIPALGALMRKDSGEVIFVELLRKDDGVLTGLIERACALSPSAAAASTERYTSGIRRALSGGGYMIPRLGMLCKGPDGVIRLEYDPELKEPAAQEVQASPRTISHGLAEVRAVRPATATAPAPAPIPEQRPIAATAHPASAAPAPARADEPKTDEPQQADDTSSKISALFRTSPKPAYAPGTEPKESFIARAMKPTPKAAYPGERHNKRKADTFMIVAIAAAAIAILAMIYGITNQKQTGPEMPDMEQVGDAQ